jgi:uncharacterized protein
MSEDGYLVQWTGRQVVVTLPEHLGMSNADRVREQLLWVINRGADVLIADLTGTVSFDYSGADAMARAHHRAVATGTQLRLVVTADVVRRILSLSGLDHRISIYPTLEAAVAAGAEHPQVPVEPGTTAITPAAPGPADPGLAPAAAGAAGRRSRRARAHRLSDRDQALAGPCRPGAADGRMLGTAAMTRSGLQAALRPRDLRPCRAAPLRVQPDGMGQAGGAAADGELVRLGRTESMRLLASVQVGRLIFTVNALPAVRLMNFALVDGMIVLRTAADTTVARKINDAIVAFEADDLDPATSSGWSVVVTGRATRVTDPELVARYRKVPLVPWAPGERDQFVTITTEVVEGRRVSRAAGSTHQGRGPRAASRDLRG